MDKRNIVFACDGCFVQHLAVALASLLTHNDGMNIYIINGDISEVSWKKLRKLLAGKDSNLINARIDDHIIEHLITHSHFTKATYYRLFIPEIVKGDKALYLDADIVVTQCIDDLYNTDISNTFLAAVNNHDVYNYQDLEMECSAKYFNSGVMLINLNYWRAGNIKERVVEFIVRKPEAVQYLDQDGLNSVINGNWLELHPRYNLHTRLLYIEYDSSPAIKEAIEDPVIIHYTGSSKPCQFMNNHPYKYLYWKYIKMTPYKYYIPDDFNMINVLKRIVPKPIKNFVKKLLREYILPS